MPVAMAQEATGTAVGFGGAVTVTLNVEDGKIVAASAVGENETPAIGGQALEKLPQAMVEANSVEVDGVSGATMSSAAILSAAKQAYDQIAGVDTQAAPVKMAPGTYTNSVWAFSVNTKMDVAVTVNETEIEDIQVGVNGETGSILASAKSC